jgi:hypothetical protein
MKQVNFGHKAQQTEATMVRTDGVIWTSHLALTKVTGTLVSPMQALVIVYWSILRIKVQHSEWKIVQPIRGSSVRFAFFTSAFHCF